MITYFSQRGTRWAREQAYRLALLHKQPWAMALARHGVSPHAPQEVIETACEGYGVPCLDGVTEGAMWFANSPQKGVTDIDLVRDGARILRARVGSDGRVAIDRLSKGAGPVDLERLKEILAAIT